MRVNEFGQPVGDDLDWAPREPVGGVDLEGRWCTVTPYDEADLDALHDAICATAPPELWTYLPVGPFGTAEPLGEWLDWQVAEPGWFPQVIRLSDGRPVGIASYLRLDTANGSVEVGAIVLGPQLQRSTAATEAMHLMARHVFDLGYRRYEWKCDSLNAPSRRAAERLGFREEGTFLQAQVVKGRNRDTTWFSITDAEWPALRAEHERWLAPENFDATGRQRTPLRPRG